MTVKNWNPGDVLTASDMNEWTVPKGAAWTASAVGRTSTTPAIDATLQFAVEANVTYDIEADLIFSASAGGVGFNVGWTVPSGSSGAWTATNPSAGLGSVWSATNTVSTVTGGVVYAVHVGGTLTTTTSGTFGLSWAPGSAGTLTLGAGSKLTARRMG